MEDFIPVFKVKITDNVAHVPCISEKKKDGSIVMHAPSPAATIKAIKEFRDNNK